MKNYIQPGRTISAVLAAACVSGELVQLGALVGVASVSGAIGDTVELELEGVFDLVKVDAQAWTFGAVIYRDAATGAATTAADLDTAGDPQNTKIGHAVAAVAGDAGLVVGRVRLSI